VKRRSGVQKIKFGKVFFLRGSSRSRVSFCARPASDCSGEIDPNVAWPGPRLSVEIETVISRFDSNGADRVVLSHRRPTHTSCCGIVSNLEAAATRVRVRTRRSEACSRVEQQQRRGIARY